MQHQRPLGGGLGGPVEVVQRFERGERGVACAHARAGGLAGEDLGLQQRLEELLVGPLLGAGPLRSGWEPLGDARRLERAQEVGEPLAHAQSAA